MQTIIVTETDIASGQKFRAYADPISIAFNRVFDETIGVGLNTWWSENDPWTEYMLPEEARIFRRRFDEGKPVSAFMMEVDDVDYRESVAVRRAGC